MSDESKVMMMLGCTEEEARIYLDKAEGDVLKAIEDNLKIPVVSGEKYIPPPPVINDGLEPEVREKLNEARRLSELFNASLRNDLSVSQVKTSLAGEAAAAVAVGSEQAAVE
jgi:hypothetical protein